jgi:MFS family permease
MDESTRMRAPEAPARLRLLAPLRIRDFALLWTGTSVSLVGDGIYYVAIAWQVYELSNAPTALSLVGVAWSVPMVLFLLGGGVVADRFDRRRVVIAADLARALAMGGIGTLSVLGALELWHVVSLVVLFGIGEAFFGPAYGAIVPDIVPKEMLVQANSLNQLVEPIGWRLLGPALGGWAVHTLGTGEAILLNAASFLVSAAAFALMRTSRTAARIGEAPSLRRDVLEGFRFVRAHVWLWGTLLAAALGLGLLFLGPYEVLVPYLVKNELGGGADDLGLVFAVGGLGAVLAALLIGQRGLPRRHVTVMYITLSASTGALAGYGVATELWHAMVASFVSGAGFTAGVIIWTTLMHRHVPTELLGRVTGLDWLVSVSLMPLSFALTGPVAEAAGTRPTLLVAGVVGGVLTLAFLFLPGMRDLERDETVEPSAPADVPSAP